MEPVILVIHLFLALGIIILVLLQRSEGGGLGMGGGGLGNFSTARGTANALTKMTAFLAAGFFITSLTLGVLAGTHSTASRGILEGVDPAAVQAPVPESAVQYIPPQQDAAQQGGEGLIDIEVVPEESGAAKAPQAPTPSEQPKPAAPIAE